MYAENLSEGDSVSQRMLSNAAKENGIWLVGGNINLFSLIQVYPAPAPFTTLVILTQRLSILKLTITGSIPEKDGEKLYNTSLSFNPKGELVAKHRKARD